MAAGSSNSGSKTSVAATKTHAGWFGENGTLNAENDTEILSVLR